MARRDVKLLGSLVDYVTDIKPYHTKLREFASEILFTDSVTVNVSSDHHMSLYLQNVWSRDDIGGHVLSTISEGAESDRFFRIPAAVWPHFSITDAVNFNQDPLGDDPLGIDLSDLDQDGLPDYEDPWIQNPNTSHLSARDWVPVPVIVNDVEMHVTSAVKTGANTWECEYEVMVYVNTILEQAYGFGNYFQSFFEGNEVTYKTVREDEGAFDIDEFDDSAYDTKTKTFLIKDLKSTFTLTSDDYQVAPWLATAPNAYVCKYWFSRYTPEFKIHYTNTGRYRVPFHQGTRVYINGAPTAFGSTYIVESNREFIQFLPGKFPPYNATISINTMKVDRLFLSITNPFDVNPTVNINQNWIPFAGAGYDDTIFEGLPYDSGLPSTQVDYFSFKIDDAYPGRVSPVAFMNSTTIENKPVLTINEVRPSALNGEIYIVYATGLWTFAVQQVGPFIGTPQYGNFKQIFDNGKFSFIVDKVWTPYYMVPDANSYSSFSKVYEVYDFKTLDPTDYLVNLDLKTQHGVVVDPVADGRHSPVEFSLIGKIKHLVDDSGEVYYSLVLNEIPKRGVYYEIRVEQNGGLNPRLHTTISEEVIITVFEEGNEFVYTDVYNSRTPTNEDLIIEDPGVPVVVDTSDYIADDYISDDYV